ncbi:hypothetical protein J2R76_003907 [Bradyrhizobium sp. USDA 4532]|uniref:hypothetical protein n=1 Tax=unclassified Bradyrhizobium TaxID=2631580 RepID=UPI00209DBB6C|nr:MULTISPECIES: hypothetical protein [unclassified Bradyrhizobium]MCP1835567.1 hypothetical protein [Bradyrhizobium sp. USDA 4545]MCP1920316.1 hypothetical protein [Bradyrhizobium sp. USDA 4532]
MVVQEAQGSRHAIRVFLGYLLRGRRLIFFYQVDDRVACIKVIAMIDCIAAKSEKMVFRQLMIIPKSRSLVAITVRRLELPSLRRIH